MATLLALPFEEFIPEMLKRNISNDGQALIDYINTNYGTIENEILELYWFKLPERCPANFLNELGYLLNADIRETDTERQKRRKIKNAIATHKVRGSWTNDAKIRIDNITGYSSVLYGVGMSESDDMILMADEPTDPDAYWATLQPNDGVDDLLGIYLVGDFTEPIITGNVYINCHDGVTTPVLTQDEIDKIVAELRYDVAPAYFVIYLGYINATGDFIKYNNGVIG